MTTARNGTVRSTGKPQRILCVLRQQIIDGKLQPGQQLPPRRQLEQQFNVSPPTLQRAVDQLGRDGFVISQHGRGTYVVDNPPHLCNYALIFPSYPVPERPVLASATVERPFMKFWTAMTEVAARIQRSEPRKIPIYYGIDGQFDTEDYQKLVRDIEAHRLAGLIFATPPLHLGGTPLLDTPGLPRVAVMGIDMVPNIAAVSLQGESFLDRALDYLAAKGCKKVAFLGTPGHVGNLPYWQAGLISRGMSTRPYWQQFVGPMTPQFARNCVHAMVHDDQKTRPDALVVSDDNLVEYATAGLVDAGVRVPGQMELVVHCNFPSPTVSAVPAQRLGFDAEHVVRVCLEAIDLQKRRQACPARQVISAVFENELDTAH